MSLLRSESAKISDEPSMRTGVLLLAAASAAGSSHIFRLGSTVLGASLREHSNEWRVKERSEEHTSELQSPVQPVCRLLLEKKTISRNGWVMPRASKRASAIAKIAAPTPANSSASRGW